jgi:hypothetical protein
MLLIKPLHRKQAARKRHFRMFTCATAILHIYGRNALESGALLYGLGAASAAPPMGSAGCWADAAAAAA